MESNRAIQTITPAQSHTHTHWLSPLTCNLRVKFIQPCLVWATVDGQVNEPLQQTWVVAAGWDPGWTSPCRVVVGKAWLHLPTSPWLVCHNQLVLHNKCNYTQFSSQSAAAAGSQLFNWVRTSRSRPPTTKRRRWAMFNLVVLFSLPCGHEHNEFDDGKCTWRIITGFSEWLRLEISFVLKDN